MYQSVAARFERTKSNDLIITFLPLALAFGLRGVLQKAQLSAVGYYAGQAALAVFLVACFILAYRFYFRSFVYTVVDRGGRESQRGYPPGSLTFERYLGEKSRIYERVLAKEVVAFVPPGQTGAPAPRPFQTYCLTVKPGATASRLYYRQEGKLYCAVFHPSQEQAEVLRSWAANSSHQTDKE